MPNDTTTSRPAHDPDVVAVIQTTGARYRATDCRIVEGGVFFTVNDGRRLFLFAHKVELIEQVGE